MLSYRHNEGEHTPRIKEIKTMENATFTISKSSEGVNIKSRRFNTYNRYGVAEKDLFKVMSELADVFNNVLNIGIDFVVE